MTHLNVVAATPQIIVAAAGVLAMSMGLFNRYEIRRYGPTAVSMAGIVAAFVMVVLLWGDREEAFGGGIRTDRFSLLLSAIFLTSAALVIGLAWRESAAVDRRGEFAGLVMVAVAGMMLVASAGDLIVLFLGIETLSIALYVLCALEVWRERSLESGLKYLITGAVGSSILLYGFALLFGATGAVDFATIGEELGGPSFTGEPLVIAAMVLIVVGLGFKASAVPFHMWTPDVYEGAPTSITAFMSTATKAAALAAFLRIFQGVLPDLSGDWRVAIAVLAAASIVVGNVAALAQRSLKRLLAYSSIAHAGYLLIGVAAGSVQGAEAVIYYLIVYLAMTMTAFAVVIIREREVENGEMLESFAGYARARPVLGVAVTLAMLSLAGFPPLAGFIGKFLLFSAAIEANMTWLAVVGALGSVVSLGYYLRILAVMWLGEPAEGDRPARLLAIPAPVMMATGTAAVAIIGLALFADPMIDISRGAAEALLAP